MSDSNVIASIRKLGIVSHDTIEQLNHSPNDWQARKLAVSKLYESKNYSEAAALLWSAPELPYRADEIAFSVRIIAKVNKNNAIRIVKEVVKRTQGNSSECSMLAKAFHKEGLPLLASRMYGASIAVDKENFDIGFELESLWLDDYGSLVSEWRNQGHQPPPNKPSPMDNFLGEAISFMEFTQRITQKAYPSQSKPPIPTPNKSVSVPPIVPPKPQINTAPKVATRPLIVPKVAPLNPRKNG